MYNNYKELPEGDIKERIAQYCYDYFFHYLLIESELIRLAYCRFLSQDFSIQQTFIENSETYKPYYNGKKLVMDVVIRDDQGRYYNIEMQNYDIESDDEIRFVRYLDRLFDKQERKGLDYSEMKDVYQLILYTGKPLHHFDHYQHILKRGDFEYGAVLEHQKAHAMLLQLRYMEEDLDMSDGLTVINQLSYLYKFGDNHKKSQLSKEVKEAIRIHKKYMDSDEIIKGYELERERMIIKSKMNKARKLGIEEGKKAGIEKGKKIGIEEGEKAGIEKGKKEEVYLNAFELINIFFNEDPSSWLKECTYNQLKRAFTLIGKNLNYDEFRCEMLK